MAKPLDVDADRDECLSNMKAEFVRLNILMKVAAANEKPSPTLSSELVEQSYRFMVNYGGMVRALMEEEIDRRGVDI